MHHLSNPSLEKYSDAKGWARETLNFACLKGFGHYFKSENALLRHVSQNLGMMLGEEAASRLHFTPEIHGNFAERFVHASAMNFALGAGTVLSGFFLGNRTTPLERKLKITNYEPTTALFSIHPEVLSMSSKRSLNQMRLDNPNHEKILGAFGEANERLNGLEFMKRTGFVQANCYHYLRELEAEGLLVSREDASSEVLKARGSRPIRYYELTGPGRVLSNFFKTRFTLPLEAQKIGENEIGHLYAILFPNHRPDFQFNHSILNTLFTWELIRPSALHSKVPYEITEKGRAIMEGLVFLDYF